MLRWGLLIIGTLLFLALGWGAVQTWITVFAEGPAAMIDTSSRGGRSGEGPAIVGALLFTLFALLSGVAGVVGGRDIIRVRRERRSPNAR